MPSRARQDPQPNMMVLPTDRTTLQARSAECPAEHGKIRNQT